MRNHQLQLCDGSAPGLTEVGAEGVVKFLQTSRHSFKPAHYFINQCRAAQCPSHANGQLSQQNSTPLLGKSPPPLVLKGAEPLFGFCEATRC